MSLAGILVSFVGKYGVSEPISQSVLSSPHPPSMAASAILVSLSREWFVLSRLLGSAANSVGRLVVERRADVRQPGNVPLSHACAMARAGCHGPALSRRLAVCCDLQRPNAGGPGLTPIDTTILTTTRARACLSHKPPLVPMAAYSPCGSSLLAVQPTPFPQAF
jgi:hypothetical protein